MKTLLLTLAAVIGATGASFSASAVNKDSTPQTLIVTEGGSKAELSIAPGDTVDFCSGGCFVTMPNGDREALTGTETLEISGGVGRIK